MQAEPAKAGHRRTSPHRPAAVHKRPGKAPPSVDLPKGTPSDEKSRGLDAGLGSGNGLMLEAVLAGATAVI
jgi:hypothetical protein